MFAYAKQVKQKKIKINKTAETKIHTLATAACRRSIKNTDSSFTLIRRCFDFVFYFTRQCVCSLLAK